MACQNHYSVMFRVSESLFQPRVRVSESELAQRIPVGNLPSIGGFRSLMEKALYILRYQIFETGLWTIVVGPQLR